MKRKEQSLILIAVCVVMLAGCANPTQKGVEQLEKAQYEQAVQTFEKVIKSGKNMAEAYHGQGIAYWEMKEYEKAKVSLEKALENGVEKTSTTYQILGDCEMILGNYEEALSYYWEGMACDGLTEQQLKEMSYNEIMAYEQLRDWGSAKVKMAVYIRKYPDDAEAAKEAEFLETR